MKYNERSFISSLAYLVFFVAGCVFVSFAWWKCLSFRQGNVLQAPYFMLAVFSSFFVLTLGFRFLSALWKKRRAEKMGKDAPGEPAVQNEMEKAWRLLRDLSLFGAAIFVYCSLLFELNFFICTFIYLILQSLWLRGRLCEVEWKTWLQKPNIWTAHLAYAGLMTFLLAFLAVYLFRIGL